MFESTNITEGRERVRNAREKLAGFAKPSRIIGRGEKPHTFFLFYAWTGEMNGNFPIISGNIGEAWATEEEREEVATLIREAGYFAQALPYDEK